MASSNGEGGALPDHQRHPDHETPGQLPSDELQPAFEAAPPIRPPEARKIDESNGPAAATVAAGGKAAGNSKRVSIARDAGRGRLSEA